MARSLVIILLVILLLPLHAAAMTRIVPVQCALVTTATRFHPFDLGRCPGLVASSAAAEQPMGVPGTVDNLYINMSVAPGAGASVAYTLVKNGSDSTLTCTVSDLATTCNDTAHPITVVAGDLLAWKIVPSAGTAPAASSYALSTTFEGDNAGETHIGGGSIATLATTYYAISASSASTTDEAAASALAPTSFTLDQLRYMPSGNPGSGGDAFTLTLNKNGSATGLACTVTDAQTSCTDLVESPVSFAATDTLSMTITAAVSPVSRNHKWGMRLTPTTDGEFPLFGTHSQSFANNGTRFPDMVGALQSNVAETGQTNTIAPIAHELRKGYWDIVPAPGSGNSWAMTSRINSGDGTITGTISDAATSANDTTHSDSITLGQLTNWKSIPTSLPTAIRIAKFSVVSFIDPGTPAAAPNYNGATIFNLGTSLFMGGRTLFGP